MTTAPGTQFDIDMTRHAVRRSMAQRVGTLLWAPTLVIALAAFFIAILLAMARAAIISGGDDPQAAAALGHLGPAFMFVGFVGVLASVSFAIARILGVLRVGGSEVQETAGRFVHTIRTPLTAKVFVVVMIMGTMIILLGVVANFSTGLAILGGDAEALAQSESSALWIEGIRRIGTAVYLVAIAFGLAAIIEVIRFQTLRLRQLPSEPTRRNSPQEN